MSIWSTKLPTYQDFPIWAFTDDSNDVVLLKSLSELPIAVKVTWCRAFIPKPPRDPVRTAYEQLVNSPLNLTKNWSNYDWFKNGYEYAKPFKFEGNVPFWQEEKIYISVDKKQSDCEEDRPFNEELF